MGRSLDGRAARSAAIGHACARALSAINDDVLRARIAELELVVVDQAAQLEHLDELCNTLRNEAVEEQDNHREEVTQLKNTIIAYGKAAK